MPDDRHEYLKSLIQQALWNEYTRTKNKDYKELYEKWYDRYNHIDITVLEAPK